MTFYKDQSLLPRRAFTINPYRLPEQAPDQWDIPLGLKYNAPLQTNFSNTPSLQGVTQQVGTTAPSLSKFPVSTFLGDSENRGSYGTSNLTSDALSFLKQKTGKNIQVSPFTLSETADKGLLGFYRGSQFGQSPDQRTVFINQDNPAAGLGTLFHETGHAVDPTLGAKHQTEGSFNPAYIQSLAKPEDRLQYLFNTKYYPRVQAETEGQRFAGEAINQFAQQEQGKGIAINPKTVTDNPYYKYYPGSYATQALDEFFGTELPGARALQKPIAPGADTYAPDTTSTVPFQDNTKKATAFGLNPALWKTQENILQQTRDYIDPRLNPYMTSPTVAAPTYWSPR